MDCLFCSIIKKEKPSYTIYEDDSVVAFLDIFPHAPAHTVVVPRRHMPTILDMQESELQPFWSGVERVLHLLKKYIESDNATLRTPEGSSVGFTIGINHGKVSGQEIEHLHIHLMPRFEGDKGGSIQSIVDNPLSTKTVAEVCEEIQKLITNH